MGQGSNSSGLRRYNERVLLTFLRKYGIASKSDLARATHLTPQAVTRIVDDLERSELVVREGRRLGGLGQPSTLYSLNGSGAYSIGVKIGRRDLEVLLMDFKGLVLKSAKVDFETPEPEFIFAQLGELIPSLIEHLPGAEQSRIRGVGVAMPWFLGRLRGEGADHDQWQDIDVAERLGRLVSMPVYFENDGAAAAIAELQLGVGKDISDFLYVNIGAFVGGGLVLQSNIEVGVHGNAAELASMPVPPSRLECVPLEADRSFASLTDRASLLTLRRHLNAQGVAISHLGQLPEVIDQARVYLQEWMDDCADALVFAFLSATSVVDLKAIVIDASLPKFIVDELVAMVARRMRQQVSQDIFVPDIVAGELGANAVAMGGGILPFYSSFAADKTVLLKGAVPDRVIGQ